MSDAGLSPTIQKEEDIPGLASSTAPVLVSSGGGGGALLVSTSFFLPAPLLLEYFREAPLSKGEGRHRGFPPLYNAVSQALVDERGGRKEEAKAGTQKSLEGKTEGALSKPGLRVRSLPEDVWVAKVNAHTPADVELNAFRRVRHGGNDDIDGGLEGFEPVMRIAHDHHRIEVVRCPAYPHLIFVRDVLRTEAPGGRARWEVRGTRAGNCCVAGILVEWVHCRVQGEVI
mmetsp:Transcript_34721/g.46897  ORF Transcript_34721/g.46897 Transcript_34721/m.46897 type:complete len:229 (-) Transcript_34721:395-1081(-)